LDCVHLAGSTFYGPEKLLTIGGGIGLIIAIFIHVAKSTNKS
jgi:hypothetical protein